ncbi:hypothetical protein BDV19DRAFT_281376 [Aspergillus venezuelensis]
MTLTEADMRRMTPDRDPLSESPSMISQIPGYNLLCRQLGRLNLLTGILYDASTDTDDVAEPSTKTKKGEPCAACYDEFVTEKLKGLSCEHRYCNGCLKTFFKMATDGAGFVQPQCCGKQIPLALIQGNLSRSEIKQFQSAETEFLSANRIYCSDTPCGSFIDPLHIEGDRAACPKCGHNTCIKCKKEYHVKEDCPADPALQAALTLAKDRGWQRCYACRTMVELRSGCYHITYACPPYHQVVVLCIDGYTDASAARNFATGAARNGAHAIAFARTMSECMRWDSTDATGTMSGIDRNKATKSGLISSGARGQMVGVLVGLASAQLYAPDATGVEKGVDSMTTMEGMRENRQRPVKT